MFELRAKKFVRVAMPHKLQHAPFYNIRNVILYIGVRRSMLGHTTRTNLRLWCHHGWLHEKINTATMHEKYSSLYALHYKSHSFLLEFW